MSATDTTEHTTPQMVDWGLAIATARRLVRPGPEVSVGQAQHAVAELRELAKVAEGHVRQYTGLHAEGLPAPVYVVDRNGWVQANADAFKLLLQPLGDKYQSKRADSPAFMTAVGSRMTGLEAGALLAFLSGKVLGQFDPFWDGPASKVNGSAVVPGTESTSQELVQTDPPAGRLLLVAPNIVQVERELGVDARDFRLWVCLHEETHRVQFTAVPWLRDYMRGEIRTFLEQADLDPSAMAAQLRSSLDQVVRAARGEQEVSLIDLVQTPEQKKILDRLTAVMSLLEGHADVVMDGVGPEVVPSVAQIREKFQRRRSGGGWFDQVIKRLLGLDAKLRQYRDGAAFVRYVVDAVGQESFNKVWESPENLPLRDEIAQPHLWVQRVNP
ncbi:zinc-dependent metalloprotease [Flindersiella endophytica]